MTRSDPNGAKPNRAVRVAASPIYQDWTFAKPFINKRKGECFLGALICGPEEDPVPDALHDDEEYAFTSEYFGRQSKTEKQRLVP